MSKKCQVVIIDDEQSSLELMEILLRPFNSDFEICAKCSSVKEARIALLRCEPDLIFLDINMPNVSGFEFILNDLRSYGNDISIIFISAHREYMEKAFKFQPFDYLLKPIDNEKLSETLLRYRNIHNKNRFNKILPKGILTDKGVEFIKPENIVYIQKEDGKSFIYLFDGNYTFTNKSLKEIYRLLSADMFCQIHKSTIVNLNYIRNFSMPKLYVKMEQSTVALDIGRSYVNKLKKMLDLGMSDEYM